MILLLYLENCRLYTIGICPKRLVNAIISSIPYTKTNAKTNPKTNPKTNRKDDNKTEERKEIDEEEDSSLGKETGANQKSTTDDDVDENDDGGEDKTPRSEEKEEERGEKEESSLVVDIIGDKSQVASDENPEREGNESDDNANHDDDNNNDSKVVELNTLTTPEQNLFTPSDNTDVTNNSTDDGDEDGWQFVTKAVRTFFVSERKKLLPGATKKWVEIVGLFETMNEKPKLPCTAVWHLTSKSQPYVGYGGTMAGTICNSKVQMFTKVVRLGYYDSQSVPKLLTIGEEFLLSIDEYTNSIVTFIGE